MSALGLLGKCGLTRPNDPGPSPGGNFVDLAAYDLNDEPTGWVRYFDTAWIEVPPPGNDYAFVVEDEAGMHGRVFRGSTNFSGPWRAIAPPGLADDIADVELLAHMKVPTMSNGRNEISVRMPTPGTYGGYYAGFRILSGNVWLALGRVSSGTGRASEQNLNLAVPPSGYWWMRLRAEGSTMTMRAWPGAVGDEPESWQVTLNDDTHASGGAGFAWLQHDYRPYDYDWLSWAFDGETAPGP